MFRGLWRLTWLEIKIFVREPMGLFGAIGLPVILFVAFARFLGPGARAAPSSEVPRVFSLDLPILASVFISMSAVISLVAIIAIYREGGILKRLKATPLRPHTILLAHVLVKLASTALTLALLILAGRRFYPVGADVPLASFAVAFVFSTLGVVSMGFVIASLVPTARFAQPIGGLVLYPMLGLSGLFVPIEQLPPALQAFARAQPFTYAVSLMRGIWHGDSWLGHAGDVAVLVVMFVAFSALSAKVFRWE
jgi:ABC-2 type transport system permease protein